MKQSLLTSMFLFGLIGGIDALPLHSASAQVIAAEDQESGVDAARLARFKAMIERDLEALDRLLTQDLTYSHTTGRVESKQSFLNTVESGFIDYLSADPMSVETRYFEEIAVATGLSNMKLITEGEQLEFTIRFLEVYRKEQGEWRLTAWQSVMNTTNK